jgi:hypothetical protein
VGFPLLATLLGVLAACGAALVLTKLLRTRWRYVARDPRRRATAARAELVGYLRDQGLDVGSTSTATDLRGVVARAYGVRLDGFADAVGRARFGAAPELRDADRARTELRRGLRAVRGRLSHWRRLRGAFSTRSLRSG